MEKKSIARLIMIITIIFIIAQLVFSIVIIYVVQEHIQILDNIFVYGWGFIAVLSMICFSVRSFVSYKQGEEEKRIEEENKKEEERREGKEILKKVRQAMMVSERVRLGMLESILNLDKDKFYATILEWADKFKFTIDGDYLIINKETLEPFLNHLENSDEQVGE